MRGLVVRMLNIASCGPLFIVAPRGLGSKMYVVVGVVSAFVSIRTHLNKTSNIFFLQCHLSDCVCTPNAVDRAVRAVSDVSDVGAK